MITGRNKLNLLMSYKKLSKDFDENVRYVVGDVKNESTLKNKKITKMEKIRRYSSECRFSKIKKPIFR